MDPYEIQDYKQMIHKELVEFSLIKLGIWNPFKKLRGQSRGKSQIYLMWKKQFSFQQTVVLITESASPFSKYVPVDNLTSNVEKLEQIRTRSV